MTQHSSLRQGGRERDTTNTVPGVRNSAHTQQAAQQQGVAAQQQGVAAQQQGVAAQQQGVAAQQQGVAAAQQGVAAQHVRVPEAGLSDWRLSEATKLRTSAFRSSANVPTQVMYTEIGLLMTPFPWLVILLAVEYGRLTPALPPGPTVFPFFFLTLRTFFTIFLLPHRRFRLGPAS